MNQRFAYRIAREEDFEKIYAVWLEGIAITFKTMPKPDDLKIRFKQNFANRKGHFNFWVAENEGNVIGWISVLPSTHNPIKQDNYGELSIYFLDSGNVSEVPKNLLKAVINELSKSPLQFVLAFVSESNIQANTFFQKHFTKTGTLPPPIKEPFYPAKHIYTIAL